MTDQDFTNAIDHTSKVTIRLLLGLMGFIAALLIPTIGFLWALTQDVRDVSKDLSAMKADRYSLPMATADAMREAIANPGHAVPDPSNPGTVIKVTGASVTRTPQANP